MKRLISLILALFLLSLAACDNAPIGDESYTDSGDASFDDTSSPDVHKYLHGYRNEIGLLEIKYLEEGAALNDAVTVGDRMITVYADGDSDSLAVINDIYSGEEIRRITLDGLRYAKVTLSDSGSVLFGDSFGRYKLFDSIDSAEPSEEGGPTSEEDGRESDEYIFYADAGYLRICGGVISLREPKSEPTVIADLSDKFDSIYLKYETDSQYVFSGYSAKEDISTTFALIKSGYHYLPMYYDARNTFSAGGRILRFEYDGRLIFSDSEDSNIFTTITLETDTESMLIGVEDRFFTYETDDSGALCIRGYGYDGKLYYRKETVRPDMKNAYVSFCRSVGDSLLIATAAYDPDEEITRSMLYLFDDYLTYTDPIETDGKFLAETVEDIKEEHGIGLFVGQSASRNFPDFSTAVCSDEAYTVSALNKLDALLDKMPDGFIDELFDDNGSGYNDNELVIYFVGKITPVSEGTTNFPIAFTFSDGQTRAIVIDITQSYSFETNMAHELMHAVDTYVLSQPGLSGEDRWDSWNDYLPSGFEYAYSYVDEYGNDYSDGAYTPFDGNGNEVYFIDVYSKTYPAEDRCRIFENLFTGNSSIFKENPELEERAKYLCHVLRDAFECLDGMSEDTVWEKTLG